MPPPPLVSQRPEHEASSSHPVSKPSSSVESASGTGAVPTTVAAPITTFVPNPILPPTSRNPPSRMPPRIGSSQPPSQPGTAIIVPSRTMVRAPSGAPAITPIVPVRPPSPRRTPAVASSAPSEPSLVPSVPIYLEGQQIPPAVAFDASQIDPQLMGPAGLASMMSTQQEATPNGQPVNQGLPVGLNDTIPAKAPRSRRAPREKTNAGDGPTGDDNTPESAEAGTAPTKKRRSRKTASEGDETASESTGKKRKRSETAEPRRSRKRAPSPPPFDPDADPGEELDPTSITMASLCDDTGRGRVSSKAAQIVSNHAAWRAANREKRARQKAMMEAKKYGKSVDDDEGGPQGANGNATPGQKDAASSASRAGSVALDPNAQNGSADAPGESEKGVDGFDYTEEMAVSRFNVQVRIGANGETIIDEQSLFVNREEEHETQDYTHVEESDLTKFVNSATYSKKLRGSRWSAEETEMFYDALSQFGENYELISYVLPGRDRKACKNKFKAEDKKNPARITYCLQNRRPYDIATLSRMTGKDFSGPTPEIRAPTPLRSTELETHEQPVAPPSPKVIRKKSRTPSVHDAGVEIVGDIDDFGKEDFGEADPTPA
ncbi:hypothetical protein PYCCODRAFT_1444596 [Trametes coccinea BRFM310]|uniref:Myb-like domain-containing protein n=1 Tax=Trametes coccinea (strain BRFM310) TaxID=1353009 RepID=A0A1Y2IQ17_TRAC3|nr:hypothetical protein PYCCODRAFT_1444596 [Trametes coccinea BRFM310]